MDKTLDAAFDRVDAALRTLISSITSYNPSPAAAVELIQADNDVLVARHQSNYARIIALRRKADAVEEQVKTMVTTLAQARQEILSTPATSVKLDTREVRFDELLVYAKRIGRFTVPRTLREPEVKPTEPPAAPAENKEGTVVVENGVDTTQSGTPAVKDEEAQQSEQKVGEAQNVGVAVLGQQEKEDLNPLTKQTFVPWPTEDTIRSGLLAQIQSMVEHGIDPATVLSAEQQAEADRRKKEDEEREKQEFEEAEKRRREAAARQQGMKKEPAVFSGLGLYDPDEE